MIDPKDFVVLSVISNVLAIAGALLTLDTLLFGFRRICPWGWLRKFCFNNLLEHSILINVNQTQYDELKNNGDKTQSDDSKNNEDKTQGDDLKNNENKTQHDDLKNNVDETLHELKNFLENHIYNF
ncbi:14808_t:CDS:2 [Gigaspora margarita]|uniref:14808_t:CDS:1 n=1 Tax=Gigaspora margarita TaxID=4874 RepID=A0ABN7V5B5_GIGMA|nr:14808_t:CDS:2 [Gigaspora margarita]